MNSENNNNSNPRLRFPGFTGDWGEKTLGELCIFVNDKCDVNSLELSTYISTENMLQNLEGIRIASKLPTSGTFTHFIKNDILFSNIRPYLKKVWRSDFEGAASNDVIVFRSKDNNDSTFVSHIIKSDSFIAYTMKGAKGVKMPRGDKRAMMDYILSVPPTLAEQEKIAACMSAMEALIAAQGQKVEALKDRKRGLMQQLFPQPGETKPRLRFPGFTGEWTQKKFKDFTFASGKRNKQNLPYERYSISNEIGFCPQSDQFEGGGGYLKDINCKLYIIVSPHSFAYNPARINVGSIGYQNLGKDVIVSSLYEVFKTNDECDDMFLWHWFQTDAFHKMVLDVQEGGVRQYFYYDKLRECSISLPSIPEQKKIAESLTEMDALIAAETGRMESLQAHKRGLMQQLLPNPNK